MPNVSIVTTSADDIESRIFTIRGLQVMLDSDLAELYQVPVKVLNQAVKRNIGRFPPDFHFKLDKIEFEALGLRSQVVTSSSHGGVRYMPYVFTEQGVSMLSAILRSDVAISISVQIIRTFVKMRKTLSQNGGIVQRLEFVEQKQIETDKKINKIFDALESKDNVPKCGVFFDGQVFDAYVLTTKIIKSAKQSIILIDNYIDESVLMMFSKKNKNVIVTLLTKSISKQLELDIAKFNLQYPTMEVKVFTFSHDRFLIVDNKEIYHIGASLKDLGKKLFAFSKIESVGLGLLEKINVFLKRS
ncbi:hypothetical protein R80B4_01776 [Fibrobacteres bacterium R8-0-B4]